MTYDIIGQCSISSTAALRRPRCGSSLAATLPRLCRPGPALDEPLAGGPDPLSPLRLSNRHHPGAAPAVAPHPEVHLVGEQVHLVGAPLHAIMVARAVFRLSLTATHK